MCFLYFVSHKFGNFGLIPYNIEFLVKLICFNFDLLWKTKDSKSIFHIVVEKRHESIFKLLNEIGSIGDLIVNGTTEGESNILHLATGLAP